MDRVLRTRYLKRIAAETDPEPPMVGTLSS
jgi:hypothetical protein